MSEEKEKRKSEQDPVSRREFLRRSALGAAGAGLGLSGAFASEGKRRFYRADELTEEQRARLRAAKAQRLHQEGVREPTLPPFPSNDNPPKE